MASRSTGTNSDEGLRSRLPSGWLALIGIPWVALCIFHFLAQHPIPFGTDRMPPLPSPSVLTSAFLSHSCASVLPVALFWLAAFGIGAAALKTPWLAADFIGLEGDLISLGLGAGAMGMANLTLGASGLLRPSLLKALLLILAGHGAFQLTLRLKSWPPFAFDRTMVRKAAVPAAFLALAAVYELLIALGPTVFYDSLAYHLALPNAYLRHGWLFATPANAYSGIPAGIEMLYAWMIPWGGHGSPCQVLHLTLGLLSALVIAATGRRLGNAVAGIWGAAIFLSSPMVLLECGRPAVELGWSFYLALTLLALVVFNEEQRGSVLVIAGLMCGLTLGTKYQAILILPAACAILVMTLGRDSGLRAAGKLVALGVLVAAPWGIRNLILYHNLVYPFLGGTVFPASTAVDLPSFLSSAHGRNISAVFGTWAGFRDFIIHPWTYSFPIESSETDNILSLVFVAGLPILALCRLSKTPRRLLIFGAVLWLPMNLVSGLARFSIPALVPLSLALAFAISEVKGRAAMACEVAAAIIFTLSGIYVHSKTDRLLWPVLSGKIEATTFLSHRRPIYGAPPFAAYQWANENLSPDAKLLLIGEPRSFYLQRDYETASPYAVQPLSNYVDASTSGQDLYSRLKSAGITHIFINIAGMAMAHQQLHMTPEGLRNLRDFWSRDLAAVFVDQGTDAPDIRFSVIYRLLSEQELKQPHPSMQVPFQAPPAQQASK